MRGIIVAAIHAKILVSSSSAVSDNAALTLISADLERISFSLKHIDQLFACPVEIGVAIFLLERQIGVSCVAPIVFSIALTGISLINSNVAVPMQKGWLASVQERVAYTAAVLNFPKGFKMLGLTEYLSQRIQALRVKELADYAAYRKYVVHRNTFSAIPPAFAPSLCLTMFTLVNGGSALTPTVAFTALSLVALLTDPIRELIHAVPQFQTALASLDRIQAFLLLEREQALRSATLDGDSMSGHQGEGVEMVPPTASDPRNNLSVKIEGGSVRLGKESKLVLDHINLAIAPETLNLIVGPVGSGKSTLLKVLIGDVVLNQGHLFEQASSLGLSYCAQEPWLPNDIVRNIVIGQSRIDEAWYSAVMQACALDFDVDTFPDGNNTKIGTKGVSLSGGQRQRLALARAVYSRKKLLLLDDALSGLDANTSQTVFERVLGQRGLCRKHGCTVVFATHAVQYLPEADHIIALGEGGNIVEQGSFDVLRSRAGYIQELSLKETQREPPEEQEIQEPEKALPVPDKLATAEQDLARRTGDIAVYKYYAKSIGWFYGSIIVITAALFAFGMTIPNLWVRWWAEAEQSDDQTHPLGLWIGIYLLFGAICIGSVFAHIWVMLVNSVPKSSAQLHKQLLRAVMRAPYSFFVNTDAGVTLNRFSSDMSLIDGQLAGAVMQTMDGCSLCVAMAGLIVAGASYSGAAIPFILLVLYAIQKFYLRTSRQLRFMDLESQAPLLTHCSETITGVTTIRAFGWQTQSHQRCLELLDNSQRPFYLQLCIQRWLNLVLDLTTAAIALIVVSMAMTLPQASSAGSIGLSMLNILSFNTQLAYMITAWTTLETSLGAVSRCKNFESMTESEDQPSENHNPSPTWPQEGQLVLNNISASYNDEGENVLKSVSVSIAPGKKVGICGRSGSGKSSLLLTLLRLLDCKAGSVILDDVDLATVPRRVIRERITTLPQEAIIVPGTLKENIDPLHTSKDNSIRHVLDQVGLIDIVDQRGGLDADMKDLTLSQGQMQLFAIARALLRKSKLVVLDEMTSSVDAPTEARILSLVREHFSDSTVIAIAHRLKTIVDFDKVIVMDKGRIVETGSPAELLKQESSYFRSMWERNGH
jgi:ABC-type multidrug transport system fused ATPase/permease subunit